MKNLRGEDISALFALPVRIWPVLGSGALISLGVILRGFRWKLLLPPDDPVPRRLLSGATAILYLVNNILPARAGEVVRLLLVRKHCRSTVPTLLMSVVVERALDGLTLSLSVLASIVLLDISPTMTARAQSFGVILGILLLGILLLEVFTKRNPETTTRWIARVSGWAPGSMAGRIEAILCGVVDGMNLFTSPARFGAVVGLSTAVWACTGAGFWILLLNYTGPTPSVLLGPIVTGAVAFAASVPAAPGYLGVFQLAVKEALQAVGSEPLVALHYSMLLWAVNWTSNNLLGLYYAWTLDIDWGQMRQTELKSQ